MAVDGNISLGEEAHYFYPAEKTDDDQQDWNVPVAGWEMIEENS